jgi:uncharacterized protein with HEPN domain
MKKDDLVYARQMLDSAEKAARKAKGITREDFDRDENLQLAIVYLIQTLGESARRVSAAFRDAHPEIPWAEIVGMRHHAVHDYLDVDFEIVWRAATEDLPPLIAQLNDIVASDDK